MWQKLVEGRAATLEWLLDNKTHLFHGMLGAIGNPTRLGTHLCHISREIRKICVFELE